jgi:hypothetical protein
MMKQTMSSSKRGQAPTVRKTNELHTIRLREMKREAECLKGAPPSQVPAAYFTPSLKEICAKAIADNFALIPNVEQLRELEEDLYMLVIDQLPTDLKLTVSVPQVHSQDYWRACCESRWSLGQLSKYTKSGKLVPPERGGWKRIYLERNLEEYIMSLPAGSSITEEDEAKLVQLCVLCGGDIYSIQLTHQAAHFDVHEQLFSKCPHLEEFQLTYQVLNAAVTFKLEMIGMRHPDCLCIQRALRSYPGLKSLSLPGNRIDADMLKAILSGLVKNNTLTHLDLSHNLIDDVGAAAIGTILAKKDLAVRELDLSDNCIRAEGGKALGRALGSNTVVTTLSLRLNRLGDQGGAFIFDRLKGTNQTLTSLNISHNQLGAETAKALSEYLRGNATLVTLDVSGNELREDGGKMLAEGVVQSVALRDVDVRNCGMSEGEVTCIQKHAQKRVQQLKAAETERLEQKMRDDVARVVAEKVRKSHGV